MKINQIVNPLAIAMWDSSWLRRRYIGGGFESFDKALDELTERGYNAVRIDAFPHMIANAPDGTNSERFLDPPGISHQKYGFAQWGSPWTIYISETGYSGILKKVRRTQHICNFIHLAQAYHRASQRMA